jgi:hypothetical protein
MWFNDFLEAVMPCVAIFAIFSLIFGFVAFMRLLRYRETLALAEKGLMRPKRTWRNGQDTLRWGIIITAVGLALCIGIYPMGFVVGTEFPLHFGPWMLIGLMPTFFGLGLVLIYYLTRRDKSTDPKVKTEMTETEETDQ